MDKYTIKEMKNCCRKLGIIYGTKWAMCRHRSFNIGKCEIQLKYKGEKLFLRKDNSDFGLMNHILIGERDGEIFRTQYNPVLTYIKNILKTKSNLNIIDGGANIGIFSRAILGVAPDANIIAIEPEKENFMMLKRNTGSYSKVECLNCGIWNKRTILKIREDNVKSYAFQVVEAEDGDIEAVSIDNLLDARQFERVDVLKLDIEGSESVVFSEEKKGWLDKCDIVVIETHESIVPGVNSLIDCVMKEKGFIKKVWDEDFYYIRPENIEYFGSIWNFESQFMKGV